jgi:hypothetical protein
LPDKTIKYVSRYNYQLIQEFLDAQGPFNSWDRQPYLTMNGVDDGYDASHKYGSGGSITKMHDTVTKNFWSKRSAPAPARAHALLSTRPAATATHSRLIFR